MAGVEVVLGGDGRCDSPGYSAKYGSYTLMDLETSKILDVQQVQSNEVAGSTHMELEGLKRGLDYVIAQKHLNVSALVTDRHVMIKKYMRENHQNIKHYFDVWHIAKGSKSFKLVKGVVESQYLLRDLPQMSPVHQTYGLEVFHSVVNEFAPKSTHFFKNAMQASRTSKKEKDQQQTFESHISAQTDIKVDSLNIPERSLPEQDKVEQVPKMDNINKEERIVQNETKPKVQDDINEDNQESVSELQKSPSDLQKEIDAIRQENEKVKKENKEFLKDIARMCELPETQSRKQIDAMEKYMKSIKKENKELLEKLNQLEEKFKQTEKKSAERKQFVQSYKEQYRNLYKQKSELEQQLSQYGAGNKNWTKELASYKAMVSSLQQQLYAIQKEKDTLLERLSMMAGMKMKDNNPAIADLSDPNRPEKLSEQFRELYDNAWTDILDALPESDSEETKINEILGILKMIYDRCNESLRKRKKKVLKALGYSEEMLEQKYTGGKDGHDPDIKLVKDLLRKSASRQSNRLLLKIHQDETYNSFLSKSGEHGKAFLEKCAGLCMHMAVQDPSMVFDFSYEHGSEFDKERLTPFTKSGDYINYLVWPVMYLYQSGPMMSKGVAQGMKRKKAVTQNEDQEIGSIDTKEKLEEHKEDDKAATVKAGDERTNDDEKERGERIKSAANSGGKQRNEKVYLKNDNISTGKETNENHDDNEPVAQKESQVGKSMENTARENQEHRVADKGAMEKASDEKTSEDERERQDEDMRIKSARSDRKKKDEKVYPKEN